MPQHFLSLENIDSETFFSIIKLARDLKKDFRPYSLALQGKHIGLLFEKPSTRTRISFEVGISRLGGYPLILSDKEIQIFRGESLPDTAKVMSQYLDALMVRTYSHERLVKLSRHSSIPIINGLSDLYHPCQALADYMTIYEKTPKGKVKLCYCGDGNNNVCHSLILATGLAQEHIVIASPKEFLPKAEVIATAQEWGATVQCIEEPLAAAQGANVFYTDVWVSMGQEKEETKKKKILTPYQLNQEIVNQGDNAMVLHCLPAHKDEEISEEVFDKHQEQIFNQAQNRLHAQMALLLYLFDKM